MDLGSLGAESLRIVAVAPRALARHADAVVTISAHAYYSEKDGDQASFLASADDMDRSRARQA